MSLHQLFNALIFYSVYNKSSKFERDGQSKVCYTNDLNKIQPGTKLFKEDQQLFFYNILAEKIFKGVSNLFYMTQLYNRNKNPKILTQVKL